MGKTIDITVAGKYVGGENLRQALKDTDNLDKAGTKIGSAWKTAGVALSAAALGIGAAFGVVGTAAKTAMAELERGAELERTASKFDNLAKSINTTGDALLGKMREATHGLLTDAQLMASGVDIMSLGLAKTEDGVVRLATVVSELGWDMQQVVLTMANNSTMRLDALGLSVEDVNRRAQALVATGMSFDDAFDLAVIEAGEEKITLLGSAAETTAGKIQQMKVAVENAHDAFSRAFAAEMAGSITQMTGNVGSLSDAMDSAARGAAKVSSLLVSPLANNAIAVGQGVRIKELRDEIKGLTTDKRELDRAWNTWFESTAPWTPTKRLAELAAEMEAQRDRLLRAQELQIQDNPELRHAEQWREAGGAAAAASQQVQGALAEISAANEQAAAEVAEQWRKTAAEMTKTFVDALDPEKAFDFGDFDAMSQKAFDMASAFGLSIPVLGDIGIQLGVIDEGMAEAAAKAAIFEMAFNNLLGKLQSGQIDTSQFVDAFDALIDELNTKSLVEIQVELAKPKVTDPTGWMSAGVQGPLSVPVAFDAKDEALQTALDAIDGIPDNQEKLITFSPEYQTVLDATEEIEAAVSTIDGTVVLTPDTSQVDARMSEIDGSHATVYVDFVPTGSIPGRASGGPVTGGSPYWVGEAGPELFVPWSSGTIVPTSQASAMAGGDLNVNMTVTFNGPADPPAVQRAIRDGMAEFYADVQRQGVRG